MALAGWHESINKVELTNVLRNSGYGLKLAKTLTDRLLDGETIALHLRQFDTLAEAEAALHDIGVEDVAEPMNAATPTP